MINDAICTSRVRELYENSTPGANVAQYLKCPWFEFSIKFEFLTI